MKIRRPKAPDYQPKKVCLTQRARLLKAFDRGASLTSGQIAKRFGAANPTATITMLKKMGWKIKTDRTDFETKYYLHPLQPVPEKYIQAGA